MDTIYDNNTLYVEFDLATEQQISSCIDHAIKQLKIPCSFFLNLVKNKNGETFKYAYVWVSNPKVYNALIGLNLDGSKRVETVKDPEWSPPKLGLDVEIKALKKRKLEEEENNKLNDQKTSFNWDGDNPEFNCWGIEPVAFNYKEELEILKNKYRHPMIERETGPLVKIPGYEWNQQQIKILKTRDEYEDYGTIKVLRAEKRIYLSSDEDYTCSLFGKIPLWITNEEIIKIFERFCTVRSIRTKNNTTMNFPIVRSASARSKFRTVIISFKKGTKDAYFAELMTRKIDFSREGKSGMGFFNLATNTGKN